MRRLIYLVPGLVACLATMAFGECGSRTQLAVAQDAGPPDTGASQTPDAGIQDASSESWSPVCPDTPPSPGTPCTVNPNPVYGNGPTCEYGGAWWNIACGSVIGCDRGTWGLTTVTGSTCTPQPGPNDPSCPVSCQSGNQTDCASPGATCYYGQGPRCDCTARVYGQTDAGFWWKCMPGSQCPTTRPRLGASCPQSLAFIPCYYESCSYYEQCVNGFWQALLSGC